MANEEHVALLKQGVEAWNHWRQEHPEILPDLRGAKLSLADLRGDDLSEVNLSQSELQEANLYKANLHKANLLKVNLEVANLRGANLEGAILFGANLRGAILDRANLSGADLSSTDLTGAMLFGSNLNRTNLSEADLNYAKMSGTILSDLNLHHVKGLETVEQYGPSDIGFQTIYNSQGEIPEVFLRGAGMPEPFIEYMRSLVGKPIEYYSCFISYSSQDQAFAERLYADLQGKGVRCWFAPHDLKIGDEIRSRLDASIRLHNKLLLVLSAHSIASAWVQKEAETAFERETREGKLVLFPVRLDDTVMQTEVAWAADLRRMRHIGDFRRWKTHTRYQQAFDRLLRDLKADAPSPDHA